MKARSFFKKNRGPAVLIILFAGFISTLLASAILAPADTGFNAGVLSKDEDKLDGPGYADGEVLVKFERGIGIEDVNTFTDSFSIDVARHFKAISRIKGQVYALLKSKVQTTRQMLEIMTSNSDVVDASPNYRVYADSVLPNDPRFNELWGLHNTGQTGGTPDIDIDAPEAWEKNTGSTDVIVAVIDTGIDYNHPDLASNMWLNPNEIVDGIDNDGNGYIDDIHGINAITGSGDPMDDHGHGSHCSGTIGGVGNNGTGVAGVNWTVKLMGTKFLNARGSGYTSDAMTCIDYIIDQKTTYGQNIVAINASYGGGSYSQSMKDAIDAAGFAGIVFCAAAGNNYTNNDISPHYPSSYTSSNIIAVTAVNHNGTQYYNYGAISVDLAAPGVSVLSTVQCEYTPLPGDIFFDDMESGASKWTHGGTLDSWAITNAAAGGLENYWHDKNYGNFWSDSPGTGYIHNVNSWLACADDIDLSAYAGQTVYLGFDGGFQFDYFYSYDTAAVEISNNSGSTWSTLANLGTLYYRYGYYYLKQVYTIPEAYKTANFRFRFHITTDATDYSYYGYKNKGWIIDHIGVGAVVSCGYGTKSGTSMATPHVTGAVALIASNYPSETAAERKARILENTVPLPSLNGKCVTGGMLNLDLALGDGTSITVTSPNGGEFWEIGSSHDITWTSTGSIETVNIEYSVDNGFTWEEIALATPNDGIYTWTVPNSPSNFCLVRVSDSDGSPSDVTNVVFSIVSPASITITSPNGDEHWETGSSHDITWTDTGTVGDVKIEYSLDNANSWSIISAGTANDGSYLWVVPNTPSDLCLVRLTDTDGYPTDISDAVFVIHLPPTITVTSPNGGEEWGVGSSHDITWTSTGTLGNVKIEYTVDNEATWKEIVASTANDGSYAWTLPDKPYDGCLVRVSETDGSPADKSNAPFQISIFPTITVTSPNGGEEWETGSAHYITWTSTGSVGNVKIEYTTPGRSWMEIAASTPNDGRHRWELPETEADNYLVRVSETDGFPADQSDGFFSVRFPPFITVTSPNGGEYWKVGSSHDITWTSKGTFWNLKLEYSIDNGSTWDLVTPFPTPEGHYSWTIPDKPSGNCLVRVGESDGDPSDTSDAVFTIYREAAITVTSPNGGETWQAGSAHDITWTSTGPIDTVKIEFSPDNGNSWQVVAASTGNDGSYNWTLPNTPSTDCRIRVSDSGGQCSDISNAPFAIYVQPTIKVTSPNGGEYWEVESIHDIRWKSTGSVGNVNIQFSTDNGGVWRNVVTSTANDGKYAWKIPDAPSANCLVRVRETDGTPSDVGNGVFTIDHLPFITLTSPNGGEVMETGSTFDITWTTTGSVGNIKIEYSIDNCSSWLEIVASTGNDGIYTWTVPANPSENCLVRVSGTGGSSSPVSDVSNAVFSISTGPPKSITVTSPNGGEELAAGTSQQITWTTSGTIGNLNIQCSTDNGTSWEMIAASAANDGSFDWTVPDSPSNQCLVRIAVSDNDGEPSDTSDATFTITSTTPTITVTSPNGGEEWITGSSHAIKWTSTGEVTSVSIEYSTNSGNSWTIIEDAGPNDGTHMWTVPDEPSNNCLVRIRNSDKDGKPLDTSDSKFSIKLPPAEMIKVTSPDGGETLYSGLIHEITWTGSESIENVAIDYSVDNGETWTGIGNSTPNDGKHRWTVPALQESPSTNCLIRVSDTDGDPVDTSDAAFSIVLPATITVTSPNGGETLNAGSSHDITWTSSGSVGNVTIEYSLNSGTTWTTIAGSCANSGAYDWTVPGVQSEHCLVRVRENKNDPGPKDVSDEEFSIDASSYKGITVISPNGGETLYSGSAFDITWSSSGINGNVKIEYSIDSGINWTEIAASVTNNGKYPWTVPDTPAETCLVRVTEATGSPLPVGDESDAVFEISTATKPTITVTSPNGGETLTSGETHDITWDSTGAVTGVIIEYSSDNGKTWEAVEFSTDNDGTYNWNVPYLDPDFVDTCLVRISGTDGDNGPFDVSDEVFSIKDPDYRDITLTSPNGGEALNAGSTHEITWDSTGPIETVRLEYSTDNGTSWQEISAAAPNQGSYQWAVPEEEERSDQCLVRIHGGFDDDCPSDTSDETFSIVPVTEQIVVTYPNGGEVFYEGLWQETTWTAHNSISAVDIELSLDNGATWTKIITTSNDGQHGFIMPETPSDTCLFRISDSNGGGSDVSDAVFTIAADLYKCGKGGISYERNPDGSIGPKVPWVEITFVSEDGSFTRKTITNSSGYYKVPLPPQRYVVTATHPDFYPYSSSPGFHIVTGNGYQTLNFFLTRK
jgi:subtilisin family serine protease